MRDASGNVVCAPGAINSPVQTISSTCAPISPFGRQVPRAALMLRIPGLAATRTRYGYFRIYILPRREGWFVNHKALPSEVEGASIGSTGMMD